METADKRKKHWFLKAEVGVVVCVICIWGIRLLTTSDIDNAKAKPDQPTPDYTEAVEVAPADSFEDSNEVSLVPEPEPQLQPVDIDYHFLQILKDEFEQARKETFEKWRVEINTLNHQPFSNRRQYETARAKLVAKYRKLESEARAEMEKQIQEIEHIQKQINDGQMSIQAGNDAAWRLLPRKVKNAAPTQEVFCPVTQKIVTGILYDVKSPSAIIDHRVMREGDIIYDAKITKIYEDKVEFEKDGRRWTQTIGETPSPEWQ